jgi:hypothetical protein
MKKLFVYLMLVVFAVSLSGCAESRYIGNKQYETFGIFNEDVVRDPNIKYEVSAGSVIFSIIFIETVIVPVYLIGWDLWEPVQAR